MGNVKKICIRITRHRIVSTILIAASVVNMAIVGAVVAAASSTPVPTVTPIPMTIPSMPTYLAPSSTDVELPTPTGALMEEITQIPTAVATDFPAGTPTPTLCLPPLGWVIYTVQPGDNLFRIGLAVGASVLELQLANCLASDQIISGQRLYVPALPPTITLTNTPVPASDLVVTDVRVPGAAEITTRGQLIRLPFQVVIQNQGGTVADIFKLSVQYAGPSGSSEAPFSVADQADRWYPYAAAPLLPGDQVAFTGVLTLPGPLHGQSVELTVLADSCSGDQFMPLYCRVMESNEGNNVSQTLTVLLPSNDPPGVAITSPESDTSYLYDGFDESLGLLYKRLILSGTAMDPEDGMLSGPSLIWTTDRTDLHKDPVLGEGTSVSATLYLSDGCGAWHTITLTAIDSDGNAVTATRRIFIGTEAQC